MADVGAALTLTGAAVAHLSSEAFPSFPPYRTLELLARTGQNLILRAEHAEHHTRVAIKCVVTANRQQLAAFLREIALLRSMHHPGIVRILDDGIHNGTPWYAMELLEGPPLPTLAAALRQTVIEPMSETPGEPPGAIPQLNHILTFCLRLAETLLALEQVGIVHRDIKPDNLLMRNATQPVLIDFGLATRTAQAPGRDVLEAGRQVVGSYAFMSPEQLRGDLSDARSDLYSFGTTMYWLLTEALPFSTVHQVLDPKQAPVAPSLLVQTLPPALERLVLRLLAKTPEHRPQSAAEVIAVLQHLLQHGDEPLGESLGTSWGKTVSPHTSLGRPRTAGRHRELSQVVDRAESLLAAHTDGLLLIVGESGMGKTRLAREVLDAIHLRHPGMMYLTGECIQQPGQGLEEMSVHPLGAFRDVFQGIFEHCLAGGLKESERVMGRRGPLLTLYHPLFQALPGQEGQAPATYFMPGEARFHLFTSIRSMLAELAPVLVILDDLQWADALTVELLQFLSQTPPADQRGVVVVGTIRSVEALERLSLPPDAWQLPLKPLEEDAVEQLVRDMLGKTSAAAEVASRLQPVVGGNPFFATEYVRALVAEKLLVPDGLGHWQLTSGATLESIHRLAPPRAIRELILRRLALMPELTRRILSLASLQDRDVSTALLAAATQCSHAEVEAALQVALHQQLLTRQASGGLRFSHDQLRRTLAETIAPTDRITFHRTLAGALERLNPAPDCDLKAVLGSHWENGQEPTRAMGYYLAVARESVERHALEAAAQSYRAYLRLATHESAERSTAWRELGEKVYIPRGALETALEAFSRAEQDAQAIGDLTLEALSIAARAEIFTWQCRFDEAQAWMETATRRLHTVGDRLTEAQLHLRFGAVLTQCWRQREATAQYRAAEKLFKAQGELRGELMALSGVAHGAALLPIAQGSQVLERCRALSRRLQDPASEAEVLWRYSASYSLRDDWRYLDQLEEAFLGLLGAGERRWTIVVLAWLVRGRILCGPAEDITELKGRLEALQERTEAPLHRAMLLGAQGQLHWHVGELDAASDHLLEGLGLLEALHDRMLRAHLLHDLGQVRAEQGQVEEARRLFRQSGASHLPEWPGLFMHVQGLVHEVQLERRAGALDTAQNHLNRALELCAQHDCKPLRLLCYCEAGHLALARGDSAKSELKRVDGLLSRVPIEMGGEVSRALNRLKRAMKAQADGFPLWLGERHEDFPAAVLRLNGSQGNRQGSAAPPLYPSPS